MNKTYRVVWNEHTNTWIAVQETAKARGKSSSRAKCATLLATASMLLTGAQAFAATVSDGAGPNSIIVKGSTVTTTTAAGQDATAIGTGAQADNQNSFAAGTNSTASGPNSTAVGQGTVASHQSATALGDSAQATNDQATAIGVGAQASQIGALAVGMTSAASALNSAAFGSNASATGSTSLAMGYQAAASNSNSLAVGSSANALKLNGIAIGKNAQAGTSGTVTTTDADAIAIGSDSVAYEKDTVALGNSAKATADSATALGKGSKADSQYATAVGLDAHANGNGAVAMGSGAGTTGNSATAIGNDAKATQSDASALGHNAQAKGVSASAFGHDAQAKDVSASAFGHNAQADAEHSVAVGSASHAQAVGAIAIGNDAQATEVDSLAHGKNSRALGERATAVGNSAQAQKADAVAVGNNAQAQETFSVAVGTGSIASASTAIALGAQANASNQNAIAAGFQAAASGTNSLALGTQANASDQNAIAAGFQAAASATDSLALGKGAQATHANSVALGADSESAASFGTVSNVTVNGITYSGFAADNVASTVSVGKSGSERAITNVGAGRISATSTDAINGSQLYLTQNVIGNMGSSLKTILGGNAALGTDGKLTMTNIGGTGKNTIHEAIQAANNNANAGFKIAANGDASSITADNKTIKSDETLTIKGTGTGAFSNYDSGNIQTQVSADGTVTVGLKKDLAVNSVTAGDSKLDTNGLTITGGPSVTKTGIDAGSKKITNVADGTIAANSKDAINGGQLHTALNNINTNIAAAKTVVTSNDGSVSIAPSTNGAGATVYDLAVKTDGTTITKAADGSLKANTTALTPAANGSIVAPTAADAGKLATAGDIANAINQAGFNLTTTASAGSVSGSSVERVNAGKTVTIDAGKNIRVTQTGNTVSIATQDNASFDSVTTGNTKIDNNGLTINGGPSVTQAGIDAAGNKITNVAPGTAPTDAVNVSQLNARLGTTGQVAEEKLRQLEHKIDKNQDRANAGIAGAIAQGTIPQVTRPSAFGLGVGTGYYGGQSALAVGASAMTDGGNWVFKGNFSVNSKGRVGAGAGALFQW